MKPDWKDAPEWANWLACDDYNRGWYWYEKKPVQKSFYWNVENQNDRFEKVKRTDKWKESLEQRPEAKDE